MVDILAYKMNKDNLIKGYKCFNHGLINRYGIEYELHKVYHANPPIRFGNNGNGFHMCKRLEDTLKYFDAKKTNVDLTEVTCFGAYDEIPNTYENEYNDNYDMYAYEYMIINKILTRDEIIDYMFKTHEERIKKFLMYYKLTDEEIKLFRQTYNDNRNIEAYIDYYQDDIKDAFVKRRKRWLN